MFFYGHMTTTDRKNENPWQGLPQIGVVSPLDHPTYSLVYNQALFPNSTEYRRADGSEGPMLYVVKKILQEIKPKTVLSVGAGTGGYDAELLRSAGCFVENYFVVEPNPHHAGQVARNLTAELVGELTVFEQAFGPDFDFAQLGGEQVDFIMFAHSLYFIPNPGRTVQHAFKALRKGGTLLIQQQADDTKIKWGNQDFNQQLGLRWDPAVPRQDHSMSTKTISDELTALSINHRIFQEPAVFFVDSFYNNDNDTALLLLCFMMNTDVRTFPQAAIDALKSWVLQNSSLNEQSGRYELSHPQGFIVVEK